MLLVRYIYKLPIYSYNDKSFNLIISISLLTFRIYFCKFYICYIRGQDYGRYTINYSRNVWVW